MNNEYLNKMIEYIEDNLCEDINYKDLAKIVGISEYSLQRIFIFLTNLSLAEYIRKRRLSKAFEELKTTNIKIIDLAIKYKYDSNISFARAFKSMFGITPSKCRTSTSSYSLLPMIKFTKNNALCEKLNYEIKDIKSIKLYCVNTYAFSHDDFLYNIRKLYSDIEKNGLYEIFNKNGMYGICFHINGKYEYYIGSDVKTNNTFEYNIPAGKYMVFSVNSREQKNIVNTIQTAYSQIIPSTKYYIDDEFNFELYTENNCYLYIQIKDKQN